MLALDSDGSFPLDAQPCEIFVDLIGIFRGAAIEIDVFDSKDETPVVFFCHVPRE